MDHSEIIIKTQVYNTMHGTELTPEDYYLLETKQIVKSEERLDIVFNSTVSLENSIKQKIMTRL